MTLDQLRYFQAVCNFDSVSRASEYLNISQPSVSSAINKLEQEFDTMLFTRQCKRLILTKEGKILLDLANDLLLRADKTAKTMKQLSDNKVLNLGVPPMLSSLILPILYKDFFKEHPDVKINIIEDDRISLVRMLDENKINMAFLPHDRPFNDRLHSELLVELNNVCCLSKNHKFAQKRSINILDLENEPLVLFKNSFLQTERILERFKQNNCKPNILFDAAQVSTIQNMAASGLAIGFVFEFLLKSMPELVGIPLEPPMHTQVSLVWNQGGYLSGDMNHFLKFFKNHFFTKVCR